MILMDFSQIAVASLMVEINRSAKDFPPGIPIQVDEMMTRHILLNSIRHNRMKFANSGNLIICCDDTNFWRVDYFPYYKYRRKNGQKDSSVDWNHMFSTLNAVREEILEYFPYKVIRVPRAEADDIIGTIVENRGRILKSDGQEEILILSADKDFRQLQRYGNVKQYDPIRGVWIKENDAEGYLIDQILTGDKGDGIPNILSDDDIFAIENGRQTPLTKKKRREILEGNLLKEDQGIYRNYLRNKQLIDLRLAPVQIKEETLRQLNEPKIRVPGMLHKYLTDNKLKQLVTKQQEFFIGESKYDANPLDL